MPNSNSPGKYIPECSWIVTSAESTLQEGLHSSGYTALNNEAMLVGVAPCTACAPDVMRSATAGPKAILQSTSAEIEVRNYNTSRVQELFGLVHPGRQGGKI